MGQHQTSSRRTRPHDHHPHRCTSTTASDAISSGILISSNPPTRDSVLVPARTAAAVGPDTTTPLAHPAAARVQRRGKANAGMWEVLTRLARLAQEAPPDQGHGTLHMPTLSGRIYKDLQREEPFPALRGREREPGLRRLDRPCELRRENEVR